MANMNISVLGPPRAGKTSTIGSMKIACECRGNEDGNFFHDIDEHSTGIRAVPDKMRAGYFPLRTPQGQIYEADFILKWRTRFGYRNLTLPFVETAGEDVNALIEAINTGEYKSNDFSKFQKWSDKFYAQILNSPGFIIIVPCDSIRGVPVQGAVLEDDPMTPSADVTITRLINNIVEYKEWTKSPKIVGLAILFTKYDLITTTLKREGLDLANPDDRLRQDSTIRFMKKYMPSTYNLLQFYRSEIKAITYLPSWINLAVDADGQVIKNSDGSPRIAVDHRTRTPDFSLYYYNILINWLRSTFAK